MSSQTRHGDRYRALRAVGALIALAATVGAVLIRMLPNPHPAEWLVYVAVAVSTLLLLPSARRAAERDDRPAFDRLAQIVIAMAALLILQRLAWMSYGPISEDPSLYLFRMTYAFVPFLYIAAMLVLKAHLALRLSWCVWASVLALVLPGLYLHTGFSLARDGMLTVLTWLLLANPLFILMMHALPRYEEQLDKTTAQVAAMRMRTELMDRLAESERRFNLVVEGLDVGVWDRWVGPPERRWWSPRFYELIGYTPDELPPTSDHLKSLLHPDDRDSVWKKGTEQLDNGDIMDVDFRLRTKHRGYRWFNSHAKADRDGNGRMVRLAGSITDIHDQRAAQDALHMAQAELTRLAYRDTLTELYNRRYFDEHFQREWERARRNRQPLGLMLIDLDHFKAYNDRYGHPAGDGCLVQVAQILTRCASRPADIVARLGGEEFGVVLPETTAAGAEEVARRVQALLGAAAIAHEGVPGRIVTLSVGIAAIEDPEGPGPAELFEQADKALYEVKRRGRNGILRYGQDAAPGTGQTQLWPAA